MQVKASLLTLLAWLAFAVAAPTSAPASAIASIANTSMPHLQLDAGDHSIACSNKNQAVTNAISIFCANPILNVLKEGTVRVMSNKDWTHEAIQWGVQILWVCGGSPGKGDGEGSPAGEVPEDACFDLWWSMCAVGDEYGGGISLNHGEQGCQEWTIPTLHERWMDGNELYWGPFLPGGGVGGLGRAIRQLNVCRRHDFVPVSE